MGIFDIGPSKPDPKTSAFRGKQYVSRTNADRWLKKNKYDIYKQLKGRVPIKDITKLDEEFYDPKKYGPLIERRGRERERALKSLQWQRKTAGSKKWLVDKKMQIFKKFSEM